MAYDRQSRKILMRLNNERIQSQDGELDFMGDLHFASEVTVGSSPLTVHRGEREQHFLEGGTG